MAQATRQPAPATRAAPPAARRQAAPPPPPPEPVYDEQWEGAQDTPTDAEDSGFGGGIVPDDGYQVTVAKAYFRTSKTSDKEYINLELQVAEGPYEGRYVFCPFYINSDSDNFRKGQKAFLAKFFEVCLGAIPEQFPTTDDDLADFVNTACWVKVTVEDNADPKNPDKTVEVNRVVRARTSDEGDQAQVDEVPPAEDPPPPPVRQAAQRPAATAARPGATRPAARPAARPGTNGGTGGVADMDDDIPFASFNVEDDVIARKHPCLSRIC